MSFLFSKVSVWFFFKWDESSFEVGMKLFFQTECMILHGDKVDVEHTWGFFSCMESTRFFMVFERKLVCYWTNFQFWPWGDPVWEKGEGYGTCFIEHWKVGGKDVERLLGFPFCKLCFNFWHLLGWFRTSNESRGSMTLSWWVFLFFQFGSILWALPP